MLCDSDYLLPENLLLSFARNITEDVKPVSKFLLDTPEEALIVECLEKNRWNKTLTAKELNISRATLWRKLKEISSDL